jgi:gamma-D-glutamyl-L-lysine dipeptidyl-peptidase
MLDVERWIDSWAVQHHSLFDLDERAPGSTMTTLTQITVCLLFVISTVSMAKNVPQPAARFTVSVPVANMYRSASIESDVVSQAIFGSDVEELEKVHGWVKVRTADQYTGWIQLADMTRGTYATVKSAIVSSLFASLYREPDVEKHRPLLTLPFESHLEIMGEKQLPDDRWIAVRLPDGTSAWIQSGDIAFDAKPLSIAEAIALARRFLGLPYRWGGTSSSGYDCSGFMQMLMRNRGAILPRDARMQATWEGLTTVDRSELQAGDLLFFGKGEKVNHTGMYIGNGEFIHATRQDHPYVQVSRLDAAPWTTRFIIARRLK